MVSPFNTEVHMTARKTQKELLPKVHSLSELYSLAKTDERYKKLLFCASENLGGGRTTNVDAAYYHLQREAQEGGMKGLLDEVNFCRDLI